MAYTVSEASKISGISSHTIRFYDRKGLFPFMVREQGEIRRFSDLDMECLEIINVLKSTGMKIKDIKKYLDLCVLGDAALEQRLQFMKNHKTEVEKQMAEYKKFMQVIDFKLWYYNTAFKEGSEHVHHEYYETYGISPRERFIREMAND